MGPRPLHGAPAWLQTIDAAWWVSGPDLRILAMNERAEALLDRDAASSLGKSCDRVLRATDGAGKPVCSACCDLRRRAHAGLANPPSSFVVERGDGTSASLLVWVAAVRGTDGSAARLVHVAVPRERERRLETYLAQVAGRTPGVENDAHLSILSPREREILELLSADLTLRAVALRLDLSYTTVRNHVQHLLRKLDAHSIAEAVARWVLRS